MLAFFFFVLLVAVILGLVGVVVHGLIWLLVIAVVVFLADFVFLGTGVRRRRPAR